MINASKYLYLTTAKTDDSGERIGREGGLNMTNVVKTDKRTVAFEKKKIVRSIIRAGIDEITAHEVATTVPEKEGITTDEIRMIVTEELKMIDPEAAMRYSNTRRLAARMALNTVKGFALLPRETMNRLKLKTGENINVVFGERIYTLRAEPGSVERNGIMLHTEDLQTVGASDGERIVVQRPDLNIFP
jgi:hypothetical protein